VRSRFLVRIDAEILQAPDAVTADCLRAKQASFHVRQGYASEAFAILKELRSRYDAKPDARISCWLNLVDGLSYLFAGVEGDPSDKFSRALALATAAKLDSTGSLAAAWLAHIKFSSLNFQGVSRFIDLCLRTAGDDDHQALARADLVGAISLHLANRYDLAKAWYAAAHSHAVAEGDEATISALMHNVTCMGVANLRQRTLCNVPSFHSSPNARLEAESTVNYDALIGTQSLSAWVPILKAQVASLTGKPAEALQIYESNISTAKQQGMERVLSYMHADIAWCYAQVGNFQSARRSTEDAIANLTVATLVDDRGATHQRLADTFKLVDASGEAAEHERQAKASWDEFVEMQHEAIRLLGGVSPK
jgi:tetratricopeptide (TPR) repeat protein